MTIQDANGTAAHKVRRSSDSFSTYGAGLIVLLLLVLAACVNNEVVPPFLFGTWKTAAPKYEGRYLRISEHTLVIGVGDSREESYAIDKIKSKKIAEGAEYTLSYKDAEGTEETLTFTYRPVSGGILQLRNSLDIWMKEKEGIAP
jgi:hypothetical protein